MPSLSLRFIIIIIFYIINRIYKYRVWFSTTDSFRAYSVTTIDLQFFMYFLFQIDKQDILR